MQDIHQDNDLDKAGHPDGTRASIMRNIPLPSWWQWLIGITASVAAVLTVMHGPQWVIGVNNLRGRWTASKAQRMIDEGRPEAAVALMINAFERSPDEPTVVRTLAVAAAENHPEEAKYLFERLDRLDAATPDDHIRLARVLSRLNDKSGALALLGKTSPAGDHDRDFWLAHGDVDASAGRIHESQADYAKVLKLSPDDAEAAVGLGRLLASSSDPARAAEGIDLLLDELQKSLEAGHFARRAIAFQALSRLPIERVYQRERLAHILGRIPEKTLGQSVLRTIMAYPVLLTDEQRINRAGDIEAVIHSSRAQSIDDSAEAMAILQAHGENGVVVRSVPAWGNETGPLLYAMRIDSLMALERWDDARKMAARPGAPLSESTRKILLALIRLRQTGGKAPDAATLLAEATAKATSEGRQSTFMAIGKIALEHRLDAIAVSAFGAAMEFPFSEHLPLNDYVLASRRAHASAGDVLRALSTRELIDRWNLDLQKHVCYFRLLLATDIEMTAGRVDQLNRLLPEDPYIRFLGALASFRLGDFNAAADKLVPLPVHRWHQGEAAVMASIFTAAGRFDQAGKLLPRINGTGMFAEETQLLSAPRTLASILPGIGAGLPSDRSLRFLDDKE